MHIGGNLKEREKRRTDILLRRPQTLLVGIQSRVIGAAFALQCDYDRLEMASLHYACQKKDKEEYLESVASASPSSLMASEMRIDQDGLTDEQRCLSVIDNRTGKHYDIPISHDSTVDATAFTRLVLSPPNFLRTVTAKTAIGDGGNGNEGCEETPAGAVLLYDPAYQNTAVAKSAICMVEGEVGKLWYRGIPVESLVEQSTFLEVAHLLIYGSLPTATQLADWHAQVMTHTALHVNLGKLMKSFNYDAHPMGMFISTFAAMSTFHPEANPSLHGSNIFSNDPSLVNKQIKRIIGKATTVAANAYRHRIGRDFNAPKNDLGYCENFLYMLDAMGESDYKPHPVLVGCLDQLFIIHAEHEMNCSTAAMLQIASSGVDPYSAVAGAAAALFGPLHGGANEVCALHQLQISFFPSFFRAF